jgi:hypothetical protein
MWHHHQNKVLVWIAGRIHSHIFHHGCIDAAKA